MEDNPALHNVEEIPRYRKWLRCHDRHLYGSNGIYSLHYCTYGRISSFPLFCHCLCPVTGMTASEAWRCTLSGLWPQMKIPPSALIIFRISIFVTLCSVAFDSCNRVMAVESHLLVAVTSTGYPTVIVHYKRVLIALDVVFASVLVWLSTQYADDYKTTILSAVALMSCQSRPWSQIYYFWYDVTLR